MSLCLYVLFRIYRVVCGLVYKNKKKGNFEIGSQPVVHSWKGKSMPPNVNNNEHVAEKTLVLRVSFVFMYSGTSI